MYIIVYYYYYYLFRKNFHRNRRYLKIKKEDNRVKRKEDKSTILQLNYNFLSKRKQKIFIKIILNVQN